MNDDNTIDIGEIIRPHIVGFYRQGVRDGARAQKVVDDMVARFKALDGDEERQTIARILATYAGLIQRDNDAGRAYYWIDCDPLMQVVRWLSGSQKFPEESEAREMLRLCPRSDFHWLADCKHEEEK